MVGVAQHAAGGYARAQHALAFHQSDFPKIVPVEIKKIESEERNRIRFAQGPYILGSRPDTRLYLRKAWDSIRIEGNDLAIEHYGLGIQVLSDWIQFGILRFHGFPRSADQPDSLPIKKAQRAHSIPLDLIEPVRTFRQ